MLFFIILLCKLNTGFSINACMASFQSESATKLFSRLKETPDFSACEKNLIDSLGPKDVIEIFGESGCGKTELLYHLIICCILPSSWNNLHLNGLNSEVVYIDNDCHFNLPRLITILEKRLKILLKKAKESSISSSDVSSFIKKRLELLHVSKCFSSNQFIATLWSVHNLIRLRTVKTIVMIDSITAFYWIDRLQFTDQMQGFREHYTRVVDVVRKISENCVPIFASKQKLMHDASLEDKTIGQPWINTVTHKFKLIYKESKEDRTLLLLTNTKEPGNVKSCSITDAGFTFL